MGSWKQHRQSLLPTAEPSRDDLLFFAGFYEGEGSASPTRNGGCIVQVPQKDPEVLFKARSFWGGSVRPISGRDCWAWMITGDRARLFLQAIYPFLSTRRRGQVDKSSAFNLTGANCLEESGTDPERAALRASMTEKERLAESNKRWYEKNKDRAKEISMLWQKENRDLVNERQRERRRLQRMKNNREDISQTSERSQLVN